MAAFPRAFGYGAVAVACLALAGYLGWRNGPEAPEAELGAKTASAPEPVNVPPEISETTKALQPLIDARPEGQAQRRAIEAKAVSGVAAVMAAWKEQPLDQETAVQTVMALKKIGSPEAEKALETLKRESPTVGSVLALTSPGGR